MAQRLSPKLIIPVAVFFAGIVLVISALSGGGASPGPAPGDKDLPARKTAVFRLSSTPQGCEVLYDGHPVGKTPMRLEREADRKLHALELSCDGYLPHREDVLGEGERTVDVFLVRKEGETAARKVEEVVHLQVVSEPTGAIVRWDGEERGRTPFELVVPKDRGPHQLGVYAPSLMPQLLTVIPDRDQTFAVTLRPPERTENARLAKVVVFSRPPGARVRFDGEDVGTTPAVFQRPADDAEHEIEVSLSGYAKVTLRRVLSSDLIERVELSGQ